MGEFGKELGRSEAVFGLGSPLAFFAVAPEDENGGEEDGEAEGEPGAVGDFGEGGGEVEAVKSAEEDEEGESEEDGEAPDDEGDKGDHTGCNESDEDDTDTVGFAELGGLYSRIRNRTLFWERRCVERNDLHCYMLRSRRLYRP